jgi:hypothetical protein
MFDKKYSQDKIFISYRREDTQGYAGRLEDSLAAYFGSKRVFRDVGGISGGDDFSFAIEKELENAGAVVVLIGQHWLDAAKDRHDRTEAAKDYVSLEVSTALEKGIPIVPVLVEHSAMPREEELPEAFKALATRNAVSITDERWKTDVDRLAKVLKIDVPGSVAEQMLNILKIAILVLLVTPLVIQVLSFSWAAYSSLIHDAAFQASSSTNEIMNVDSFSWAIPSASFIAIMTACYLLIQAAKYVEHSQVKYIYWSFWVGGLSTLGSFISYGLLFDDAGKIIAIFASSTITIIVMLALMIQSGFKSA